MSWVLFQYRHHLNQIGIPIIKIRWFYVHLIFIIGIAITGKIVFCTEMGPSLLLSPGQQQQWYSLCNTGTDNVNSLRPRQNGRLFADDTFKRIFLNENIRISTKNSLKFVPKGLINNIPALVLIMAWGRPGDKPLSEPMLVRSLTHIWVTRPQWVNLVVA